MSRTSLKAGGSGSPGRPIILTCSTSHSRRTENPRRQTTARRGRNDEIHKSPSPVVPAGNGGGGSAPHGGHRVRLDDELRRPDGQGAAGRKDRAAGVDRGGRRPAPPR